MDMAGGWWLVVKMDVEVAAGVEIPRTNGFARRAEWILGDLVLL